MLPGHNAGRRPSQDGPEVVRLLVRRTLQEVFEQRFAWLIVLAVLVLRWLCFQVGPVKHIALLASSPSTKLAPPVAF